MQKEVYICPPSLLKPQYIPMGSIDPLAKVGGGTDISQVQQASVPAVFNFKLDVLGHIPHPHKGTAFMFHLVREDHLTKIL